jgi:NAD(P)-dependent dehydrogenase (short-subunit alcohol dehydrogenase family)
MSGKSCMQRRIGMSKSNNGRLVIITGANSGIGKAAALKFAAEGWRVIMACRSLDKGRKAQQEIIAASGNRAVQLMQLDISSFDSIRRFCSTFKREHRKLDVLIHNAGFMNHGIKTYQFSPDGLELTFATHVFGPLLMTELLRESLAASDDPRVLHAASTNLLNFFDPKREIEFDNLRGEFAGRRPYSVYKMYGDSKMGLLLLTYRMAEEYRAQGIKVNAVMIPHVRVSRETLNGLTGYYRIIGPIIQNLNPFSLTPEEMAGCYYHICASAEFRRVTGALVDAKNRIILPAEGKRLTPVSLIRELWNTRHTPAYANNPVNIEQMWRLSRQVISGALAQGA